MTTLPKKFLGTDEDVILHVRTHGKALILPWAGLIVTLAATWAVVWIVPADWWPWSLIAIWGVALIGLIFLFLLPYLRWRTSTYTVTDRRIITRKGILNKSGHDLPLSRINNITYERSLTDRILGCGTLVLTTAAEAPVTLPDLPNVERTHVMLTELLFSGEDRLPASDRDE